MSYKAEVIADSSGKWVSNGLAFATEREAQIYVNDLAMRWLLVRETRVVPSDEPVNYAMVEFQPHMWQLRAIEEVKS